MGESSSPMILKLNSIFQRMQDSAKVWLKSDMLPGLIWCRGSDPGLRTAGIWEQKVNRRFEILFQLSFKS